MKNSKIANIFRQNANRCQERADFYYPKMKSAADKRERMWYAEKFRYWNNAAKDYRASAEKYS